MICCISDLREKEIINIRSGHRLGCVCDVEFDNVTGKIVSIIIYGKCKFMGIFGRQEDIKIYWDQIKIVGDDIILVDIDAHGSFCENNGKGFGGLIHG